MPKLRRVDTPKWARKIVAKECPQCTLYWYKSYTTSWAGECITYHMLPPMIKIFARYTTETIPGKLVLLHELVHAKLGEYEPDTYRGKPSYHGPTFWKAAAPLYDSYDLLEEASKYEHYKGVRKYCKEYLERKQSKIIFPPLNNPSKEKL